MSFKQIWTAIYNELLPMKTSAVLGEAVAEVYNRDIKIEWGLDYPLITITPTNGSEEELDSCLNAMNVNFAVTIVDQITNDYATAEDKIRLLADTAIERLKTLWDISYSNGVTYRLTYEYQRGRVDVTEPVRICTITCKFEASETK